MISNKIKNDWYQQKMDINLLTLHITILLLLSTFTCAARLTKEGKARPQQALVLCGDSFVKAWIRVCKLKHQSQRGRKKRNIYNIQELVKPRAIDLIGSDTANQFLNTLHRKRRQITGETDNPSEECCHETCTFKEILEYKC
ncbi:uncharacterized protein LOC130654508 isoform X1 [Hydractinia symbiolongicarpus]|uniref:uncharacterized protein LOC130654508 isoform X1 n=2 Tax=Hydractinia symbiolongicarpus TaxID=13093 RepID=UPI002550BBC0|nr:uncharacterized protein LOC130654508 isoform X1 [Hydractinia symbiolongicarpus]